MTSRTVFQRHGDNCLRENRTRFDGRPIYIYAYTDDANTVLYIGRTSDPGTRHGAHRQLSSWWTPDLTFAVIETVEGWPTAVEAEARAIQELRPIWNIHHNRRATA